MSLSVTAKEPIVIALTHIPKVLEFEREDAPYNRFIKRIHSNISIPVRFDFMSSERSNRLLERGKVDCLFPIIKGDYNRAYKTKFSEPINGISLNLFALDKKYQELEQLNGKIVVHLRGYLFANAPESYPNIKFFPASSQESAINMLENGRASAYLDYLPDVRFSIPKRKMSKLQYDKNSPILKANDSFECLASASALVFLQQANLAIKELKRDGELKEMLGNYYVPVLPEPNN